MNKHQFAYNHKLLRNAVIDAYTGLGIGNEIRAINIDVDVRDFDMLISVDFLSEPLHRLTIELETESARLVAKTMFSIEDSCQAGEIDDASKELINIIAGGIVHAWGNGCALETPRFLKIQDFDVITKSLNEQASLTFAVNEQYCLRATLWGGK